MILSNNQLTWVFNKVQEFAVRWTNNLPSGTKEESDKQWTQFLEESKRLFELSRNNPLMKNLLLQVTDYMQQAVKERNDKQIREQEEKKGVQYE